MSNGGSSPVEDAADGDKASSSSEQTSAAIWSKSTAVLLTTSAFQMERVIPDRLQDSNSKAL
jgi:hypothetical protein